MNDLTRTLLLSAGLLPGLTAPLPADPPVPMGPETPLATATTGHQALVEAAGDGAGGFLAVWVSPDEDGTGIVSRRFSAPGVAVGPEHRVNSWIDHDQASPSVARLAGGDFVVVWETPAPDEPYGHIRARRVSDAGVPLPQEIDVHTTVSMQHGRPVVRADATGGFVVVWVLEGEIAAQRFDAAWRTVGPEMVVHPPMGGGQEWAALAVEPDGSFLVAWTDTTRFGSDVARIRAVRFDAGTGSFGPMHRVNVATVDIQAFATVARGPDRGFLVAWMSYPTSGSPARLRARRLDPDGEPVGDEIGLSDFATGTQWIADVARVGAGYLAAWTDHGDADHPRGIYAREISPDGSLRTQFRVDDQPPGTQHLPRVAALDPGRFLVTWAHSSPSDLDVYGRGFRTALLFSDGFESGDLSAWR